MPGQAPHARVEDASSPPTRRDGGVALFKSLLEGSRTSAGALPHVVPGIRPGQKGMEGGNPTVNIRNHVPQGPDGTWKTGQRVPFSGNWADQYGVVSSHDAGTTFPPCIDRKGECAFRILVEAVAAA